MPTRIERFQHTGDLHFVTFSCNQRRPYFDDAANCLRFEQSLERIRRSYVLFVFGYVVMPEHVHLLLSEPQRCDLSRAIQALKVSVSKQAAQKPFWLARYYDFNVHSEEKRMEKLRYIHRNPVTRGLVYEPLDWKWSSFNHYLTGKPGNVEIESPWTIAQRSGLKPPMRAPMQTC